MAAPPRPPRDDDPRSEPWASIDEVAAHLGVRKDSIYRWIERRGLPAQKIGKLWKLKLSEVDKWMLAEGQRRSETPGQNPATATPRDYVLDPRSESPRAGRQAGPCPLRTSSPHERLRRRNPVGARRS